MRVIRTAHAPTTEELVEAFEKELQARDLAPATIRAYLSDLRVLETWLTWAHEGRSLPLTHVRTVDLAAFRKHLIQEEDRRPATVNRRIQSLRIFYGHLEQQGRIAKNPALRLRFMRRSARRRPGGLKRREVLALLHAAASSPHGMAERNTALVQLMLQTGLRVGEVARLRRGDLTIKERSGSVRVRAGKGMKAREVPLNKSARGALSAYLEARRATSSSDGGRDRPDRGDGVSPKDPFFLSKRARPLSVRGIQSVVTTLGERAGIDRIEVSPHTLRHTFALNYLRRHPGKLVELAALLGHESLDTTAIYTQPSEEDLSDDLERSPLNIFGE